MAHICIWCDAILDTRMDLEEHVASEHPELKSAINVKI